MGYINPYILYAEKVQKRFGHQRIVKEFGTEWYKNLEQIRHKMTQKTNVNVIMTNIQLNTLLGHLIDILNCLLLGS